MERLKVFECVWCAKDSVVDLLNLLNSLDTTKLGISETSAQLGAADYAACARAPEHWLKFMSSVTSPPGYLSFSYIKRLQEAAKNFMDLKFAPGPELGTTGL